MKLCNFLLFVQFAAIMVLSRRCHGETLFVPPRYIFAAVGSSEIITCSASDANSVAWSSEYHEIAFVNTLRRYTWNSTDDNNVTTAFLRFIDISKDEMRSYDCFMLFDDGSLYCHYIWVYVREPESLLIPPRNILTTPGSNVTASCSGRYAFWSDDVGRGYSVVYNTSEVITWTATDEHGVNTEFLTLFNITDSTCGYSCFGGPSFPLSYFCVTVVPVSQSMDHGLGEEDSPLFY
ncbi:uncharacterized protein [Dysidea avara]|uniref:uncharacterized protein n=1 Tax=Dysidea avara TaxID=196820 RepID=UPI00331D41D6